MALLDVQLESVDYPSKRGVLRDVRFQLEAGETLALIGQSGSGKSTLALAILRLLEWKRGRAAGSIHFDGRGDLLRLDERRMREVRGKEIALVLQSAGQALNPMLRIETQFREAWEAHCGPGREASWKSKGLAEARRLLREVDLPAEDDGFLRRYPREVSLGQAQRVLIAMSLLHGPKLLLADEPTSALDVITQKEVLSLLRRMTASRGMATLFISHDLLSVAALADRVAILHEGRIVEMAGVRDIFLRPRHPYTQQLIAALPAHPLLAAESAAQPGLEALGRAVGMRPEEPALKTTQVPS